MKNNKRYIILIVILIIFGLFMYFKIGKPNVDKSKVKTTIILNPNVVFEYGNNRWLRINKNYLNDYQWKKYSVFLDSKYKGKYYLWNDDQWYIFDDNKNAVNYTEKLLAVKSNFELNVKEYEVEDNNNLEYISKFLTDHGLSISSELTVNNKIVVDIDNDDVNEEIYIVSNTFPIDTSPELIFSYVFMVKNNQIITMYEKEEKGDVYSGCLPYINSILDTDNDGNYEFVLTCARYSVQEPINSIYKFENNAFKQVISSE